MNRMLKTVFANRGYTSDFLSSIEQQSDDKLFNIGDLSAELRTIYENGDRLVVLPDFDMDGIMSGVVGFAGFAELGFNVSLYIPKPSNGYGFGPGDIDKIVEQYPDVKAIITCDVGMSCDKGVSYGRSLGLKMLVTDHHKLSLSKLVDADCIVNPMSPDDPCSFKGICGATVLYECLCDYAERYCDTMVQDQIRRLKVFAGIGTISDVMPLHHENRELVRDCVSFCRLLYSNGNPWFLGALTGCEVYLRAFNGLFVALNMFGELGKISGSDGIDETFFGFYLAPTFNSVKRVSGDMVHAFGVFFGNDPSGDMGELIAMNDRRKALVKEYMKKLGEVEQKYAPYVYISDAPAGILGLIATACMKDSGMPTIVVNEIDGHYSGSGRSPSWYPVLSIFASKGFSFAGHEGAFGASFANEEMISEFVDIVQSTVDEYLVSVRREEHVPDFTIALDGSGDSGLDIPLFAEFISDLDKYRPFGEGFPEPEIVFNFKASDGKWTRMGKLKQHLKITFDRGFEVICWNQGNDNFDGDDYVVTGRLSINTYNDKYSINLIGKIARRDT